MASPNRMQQFEVACRAHGLPVTVQRRRIFEILCDRADHPTPDQVYAAAKDILPGVSRTTVYRVLETLVRVGVVARASSPGAASRVDPRTSRHHHLVCQRCGRLFDVDEEAVEHRIRPPDVRRLGFVIQGYSIHFTGVCASCQKSVAVARSAKPVAVRKVRAGRRPRRRDKRSRG